MTGTDSPNAIARPQVATILLAAVTARLRTDAKRPLVLGLCGAQGSGKSTASRVLVDSLLAEGLKAVTLSLDDLYLSREQRLDLARTVHPLLATRGPPGTHDVALGEAMLDRLARPGPVRLPRFDKSADTRAAIDDGEAVDGPMDVIVFEGWCVGARPQFAEDLAPPINDLERDEDQDGRWRSWVNQRLAQDYPALFDRIDLLVLLAAPDFSVVAEWRRQQEHDLRRSLAEGPEPSPGVMTDQQIDRFVQHYERLTRHILDEMPGRADLVIRLDSQRRPIEVTAHPAPQPSPSRDADQW